jgi:hypothetical protein
MPKPAIDSIGERFGRLDVIDIAGSLGRRGAVVNARCDCGSVKEYTLSRLRSSHTKSCGCWHDKHDISTIESLLQSAVPMPDTGCWLWCGIWNHRGYGRIGVTGRTRKAHRLAYELAYGPIPKGLWVLHYCDTPQCIFPEHLWLGNCSDNNKDAGKKRRTGLHKWARRILGI